MTLTLTPTVLSHIQAHESYHGERTADAISNFALQVLKEVIAGDPELEIGTGTDSTGDGRVDSKLLIICVLYSYISLSLSLSKLAHTDANTDVNTLTQTH